MKKTRYAKDSTQHPFQRNQVWYRYCHHHLVELAQVHLVGNPPWHVLLVLHHLLRNDQRVVSLCKNIVSSFRDDEQNCIFVLYKDASIARFELSSSAYTVWFDPESYHDGVELSELLWCALTHE